MTKRLRIIVGLDSDKTSDHARRLLRSMEERAIKRGEVDHLFGIPRHTARYPIVCDDCGNTFWASDPYAFHPKCSKRQRNVGF